MVPLMIVTINLEKLPLCTTTQLFVTG